MAKADCGGCIHAHVCSLKENFRRMFNNGARE